MPDTLRYKQVFRECYNFLLAHSPPSRDEAYWLRMAEDAGKLCGALGSDPLAVDLLAAIYIELERECI